jgi:hypothetical protein
MIPKPKREHISKAYDVMHSIIFIINYLDIKVLNNSYNHSKIYELAVRYTRYRGYK